VNSFANFRFEIIKSVPPGIGFQQLFEKAHKPANHEFFKTENQLEQCRVDYTEIVHCQCLRDLGCVFPSFLEALCCCPADIVWNHCNLVCISMDIKNEKIDPWDIQKNH
jgi:hypothetical protein